MEQLIDRSTPARATPARRGALDAARTVLMIHVAGTYGWCKGCLDAWARLAPVPCPTARTALSALSALSTLAALSALAGGGQGSDSP